MKAKKKVTCTDEELKNVVAGAAIVGGRPIDPKDWAKACGRLSRGMYHHPRT